MRKGQGATEYLIILAVVIIIALIVVSAMGGIPGIGTGAGERASQAYWASQDVAITTYAISDDGATDDLTMVLKNNLRNQVRVDDVRFTSAGTTTVVDVGNVTIATGGTTTITDTDVGALCTAGNSYDFQVTIYYVDTATNAGHTFTGTTNLVGTCAS